MLAFVAPPLAPPYIPPLRLPPLRGPVTSPYRPPVTNRPPGTQPAPIYQPPDLLPPTGLDLKGEVCIFANTPIWEPKKIRYRYPGENWQEIVGESYLIDLLPVSGGDYPATWVINPGDLIIDISVIIYAAYDCEGNGATKNLVLTNPAPIFIIGSILSVEWWRYTYLFQCGNHRYGNSISAKIWEAHIKIIYKDNNNITKTLYWDDDYKVLISPATGYSFKPISRKFTKIKFTDVDRPDDPPKYKCQFTVFDVFNNVILDIIRDECPEVIIIPERCYFKPENERLVAKVIQSFLDPPLRIEYQGNCVTVWKDSWPINYFPLMIYKECTDNPNCPPPRIRLDNKKCKEECSQCPSGTAIKVLLGGNIACVDAFGCIIKEIKFKPGCNSYDCICG